MHNAGGNDVSGSGGILPIPDEKGDRVPFKRVSEWVLVPILQDVTYM